jgi:hypothetical protein
MNWRYVGGPIMVSAIKSNCFQQWLSRVHFCLGGLTSGVNSTQDAEADPASYLAKSNIILGTDGCNAHMTRTENAIINSLEFEASSNLFGLKPGLIWTTDNHERAPKLGASQPRAIETSIIFLIGSEQNSIVSCIYALVVTPRVDLVA